MADESATMSSFSFLSAVLADLKGVFSWQLLAAFFGVLAIIHRFIASLFYSRFGVAPEEAGVGYAESLVEAAVGTFVLLLVVSAVLLVPLIPPMVAAGFGTALAAKRVGEEARRHPLETFLSVAQKVAIPVVFVAGIWASRETSGWVRWFVLGLAGLVIGALLDKGGRVRRVFATEDRAPEPERDRTRLVKLVIYGLTALIAVILVVDQGLQARRAATAVKDGKDVQGFPYAVWRAQRATVSWLSGAPPSSFADVQGHCLMYLGQANGAVLLYDVDSAATRRLPSAAVSIAVDEERPSCER